MNATVRFYWTCSVAVTAAFFNIDFLFNKNCKRNVHPVSVIASYEFHFKIGAFCAIDTADRAGTPFNIMAVLYNIRLYGMEKTIIK